MGIDVSIMGTHEAIYNAIERGINTVHDGFYARKVSPRDYARYPFDRWFKMKEGFGWHLSLNLLEHLGIDGNAGMLDPFCGSGSSLIGARARGVYSAGIEVNPFLYLLSSVKMRKYSRHELGGMMRAFNNIVRAMRHDRLENLASSVNDTDASFLTKLYGTKLNLVLNFRDRLRDVPDPATRDFLTVAFGCIIENISFSYKDGNGIRYDTSKMRYPLFTSMHVKIREMINDLSNAKHVKCDVYNHDSRTFDYSILEGKNIEISIFSPPYANSFDYSDIYKAELWSIGFINDREGWADLRERSLSSHLNKKYTMDPGETFDEVEAIIDEMEENDMVLYSTKVPRMIRHYFSDMHDIFVNLTKLMQGRGKVACIVGNSSYNNVPVATDLLLANQLKELGYDVEIRVARKLSTSVQQKKAVHSSRYLRESIVIAT